MADIVCPVVRSDVTCYWKDMWRRLDAMRRLWQLCDVRLRTDDGSSFMAHSPVLAASSDVLHHMLVAVRHETFIDGPGIVPVRNVTPDILRITLDFIYGVTPTSRADFERLRVGAAQLGIEGAYEYCCRRLGENFARFPHPADVTVLPPGPSAVNTVATSKPESSCATLSSDLVSRSTEDQNSLSQTTQSVAVGATSEVPELVDPLTTVVPLNDIQHTDMMAHMSLADLARSDECPHLRRLASEILAPPTLEDPCSAAESSASLASGSGLLDRAVIEKSNQSDSPQFGVQREEKYDTEVMTNESEFRADTTETSTSDLSSSSHAAASMLSSVEVSNGCPQTVVTDSINGGIDFSTSVNPPDTALNNFAAVSFAAVTINSPVYATGNFPTMSLLKTPLTTSVAQDVCISYIADNYPATGSGNNSAWQNEQHQYLSSAADTLPSLSTCVQPTFGVSSFSSILNTANGIGMDTGTVCSSGPDIVQRSASLLSGCPQDGKFTQFGVASFPWPNDATVNISPVGVHGISEMTSVSAHSMMYFDNSSVGTTVHQYVPPVLAMHPSSSSSIPATATSSVAADLSYISLDDVSAVLKANGFSDKMSLLSASEVSPENHTSDNHVGENHLGENHSSGVNTAGPQTTANETVSSVMRACIFCQKTLKSER